MADEFLYEDESSPDSVGGDGTQTATEEPMIPKHRFDEVSKRAQEAMRRIDELEAKQAEPKTPEAPAESPDQLNSVNEQLMKLPAMKSIHERIERLDADERQKKDAFLRQAESKFVTFGEQLGLAKDDQSTLYELQSVVAERIRQDPHLTARFRQNDPAVLEEAYQKASSSGLIAALRRGRKAAVESVKRQGPAPPRDVTKAVAPEKKEEAKDLSERAILQKAHQAAYDRLKGLEGDE